MIIGINPMPQWELSLLADGQTRTRLLSYVDLYYLYMGIVVLYIVIIIVFITVFLLFLYPFS